MMTKKGPANAVIDKRIADSSILGIELNTVDEAPCITFADYMAICLYDPLVGYYRSGVTRIGKGGDFYTSSGIGDLLARSIGASISGWEAFTANDDDELLIAEWGAGTGRLSAQLAIVLNQENKGMEGRHLFRQLLIEDHSSHSEAIKETYQTLGVQSFPEVMTSNKAWSRAGNWLAGPVFVFANELLDAFPVHRIIRLSGTLWELGVAGDERIGYRYVRVPLSDERLLSAINDGSFHIKEGQMTEINLAANEWVQKLGQAMSSGRLMIIDYGDTEEELTGAHRMAGTLMTYRAHQASDTPFDQPGGRDLTAHVNFSALRREAERSGFRTIYYGTQKQFLVDHGILALLQEHDGVDPFSSAAKRNRAIRQLLLSDGMSESFKVLLLEK
ncbi:class I SAM-dependent methyltransferase [Paenibacillus sp. strain BS8-2]